MFKNDDKSEQQELINQNLFDIIENIARDIDLVNAIKNMIFKNIDL